MWQCIGQGVHLLHWQVVKLQDRTLLRLIADAKVVFCLDSLYGRGGFDGFMDSNIRQKPKKVYCMFNFQGVILCQLWVRGLTERGWGQEWITPQRHINHRVHYLSVQGRSSVRKKQYLTTMTHQTKKNIKSILPSIYLINNIQHHPTSPPQIARTKKIIAQLLAATNQLEYAPETRGVPSLRMPPFVLWSEAQDPHDE